VLCLLFYRPHVSSCTEMGDVSFQELRRCVMLPPTRAALLLHTVLPELGPNYIAMRNKSYSTTSSVLPPVEQNSWSIEKCEYSCAKSHFASNLKQSLNLPNVRANQMQRKVLLQQQEYTALYSTLQTLCRGLCKSIQK